MRRLTLGHVFAISLAGLVLLLGALLYLVFSGSQRSIEESSRRLRSAYSERIGERVLLDLGRAQRALDDLEQQIHAGACLVDDPASVEAALFVEVLSNPELSEITLTRASASGHDPDGALRLAPGLRWQRSAFRESADPKSAIVSRSVVEENGRFRSRTERRDLAPRRRGAGPEPPGELAPDPTTDETFRPPVSAALYGHPVWTDLSWAEPDKARPVAERRTVLTVMKAVEDEDGRFAGVLRVGSWAEQVDRITSMRLGQGEGEDPHRKFLCDALGRLVTRLSPEDRRFETDDGMRVAPRVMPPEVAAALQHPALREASEERGEASGAFAVGGRRYLVSFRRLTDAEGVPLTGGLGDWRIGVVVPEEYYLGALHRTRRQVVVWSGLLVGVLVLGGLLVVGAVRRGLTRIVDETARMRGFDFTPSAHASLFRDVREALESLELAKTAMRAMGKYVPVDLVRHLYATNREPTLGGQLQDVTLLFSDVKDFTSLAERLTPDRLARALGSYFEVMTACVHHAQGTVDKYIGDAVMALWNAPRLCLEHPAQACAAALACVRATKELYASAAWEGLPPLVTRFGLHRDNVMVGHFGAPDRMSYTALGDGVNLASRVEGLNKLYATEVLATEAVYEGARGAFEFRRLDRVAVKGKTQGTLVFELLGLRGSVAAERLALARAYEAALELYFQGDFAAALARFEALEDGASQLLGERCRRLLAAPASGTWTGVYAATSK